MKIVVDPASGRRGGTCEVSNASTRLSCVGACLALRWWGCQAVRVTGDVANQGPPEVEPVPRPMQRNAGTMSQYWREVERRRRLLAERLARELANPDPNARRGALSDFVAANAVKVRWARSVDAQAAIQEAPTTVMVGGEMGRVQGRGGVVLWVHSLRDDDWSLVVPFEPFRGPLLVCTDDFFPRAMWISGDSPEARGALTTLETELIFSLAHRAEMVEKGLRRPD
jgi:hypothetical protein